MEAKRRRRHTKPARENEPIETEEITRGAFTQTQHFRIAILLSSYRAGIPFEEVFESWTGEELEAIIDRAAQESGREYWGLTKDGRFRKKPGRPRKK